MLGAIIGDIVGSTREWHNVKTEDFELLPEGSRYTDDTVMTLAVAKWLMDETLRMNQTVWSELCRIWGDVIRVQDMGGCFVSG